MFPYTEPRELNERDMRDVSAFLSQVKLPTRPPVFKDTDSALDRLLMMEKVLVVPRIEGDPGDGGESIWEEDGASDGGGEGSIDAEAEAIRAALPRDT